MFYDASHQGWDIVVTYMYDYYDKSLSHCFLHHWFANADCPEFQTWEWNMCNNQQNRYIQNATLSDTNW